MRVQQARAEYDHAVRDERLARIAAAPALRRRTRRRHAASRLAVAAMIVVAVVAFGVGLWGLSADDVDTADAVQDATSAVTTMLTPDPADPQGYVDAIVDGSTGEQRERLSAGRDALTAYVSGLQVRPDGRVVSAGVESATGEAADVIVVAQAADPSLIGGREGTSRVTVRVRMTPSDDGWLVAETQVIS